MTRLQVEVDYSHGGRFVSLRGSDGHEWLWRGDARGRENVRPGDPFVDAGGLEECFPTVSGTPDHGEVWSRPWQQEGAGYGVRGDWYHLHRRLTVDDDRLVADYRLEAEPGRRFIWAGHALLELSPAARVLAPAGLPIEVSIYDDEVHGHWPDAVGMDLAGVGPDDDGSVVMAFLPYLDTVAVRDGRSRLLLRLSCAGQPYAIGYWRNLCGWPAAAPYRSIGLEPMLGRRTGLATAPPGQTAQVPGGGVVEWSLEIVADTVEAD